MHDTEMPNPFKHTFYHSTTSITHKISIIIIIIILLSQSTCNKYPNLVQCSHSNTTTTYTNHLGQLKQQQQEIIQPLYFEIKDNGSSLKTFDLNNRRCPETLRIQFSGFGNEFVIDLVKNKRLISDKYFSIINEGRDKSGSLINSGKYNQDSSSSSSSTTTTNTTDISQESHINDEFYVNHKFIQLHDFTGNDDHCHYHGLVDGNDDSISAISIVNSRRISGFFRDETYIYYLDASDDIPGTLLTRVKPGAQSSHHETYQTRQTTILNNHRVRRNVKLGKRKRYSNSNPDNRILHEPFQSNSNSLYVELLVVHDHNQFLEYDGNSTNIAERTMQIVNIMNAFYRQLNIFIALVGVVLWAEKDEIVMTEDGDATLNNFLKYRYEKLLPRYHHDNAQLITSTSFNGSVVGKALKGPICTHDHSGGVNTDHSHVPAIVAVTLAHELGHNLGMEHDEDDKCKCPDEKCIMSSSSSAVHPKHWSACSIDYLEDSKRHGLLDCLMNEPERVFGPVCGNGFVEDGEDCDMGEPMPSYGTSRSRTAAAAAATGGAQLVFGANPCCDRLTCKFVANASCAQGPCCDLSSCSVYNSSTIKVCRPKRGECDFEETCDGHSEYCPKDAYHHDGLECGPTAPLNGQELIIGTASYNRSRAYCYSGLCASHESQCQLLWGPTGSASKDICYEQNIHGNTSGNCGYDRKEKVYNSCELEDSPCGMLHCVHNQPSATDSRKTGKLGYGFESASILTVSFFVMTNHAKIFCHGAIIDAGPSVRDPGLVPNGAACGDDRMCLDHKCLPIQDVIYKSNWCPSDCNGNGICDNLGVCHCYDGTIGTSCYQFFGSNFHLSLFLYVIMFFVPIVGLIALAINHYRGQIKIWWFLHNRKIALRNKSRQTSGGGQPRRMTYNADGHRVMISEPIPLNQQNNIGASFYKPDMDPWAETTTTGSDLLTGGKSPGYRLEPIKTRRPSDQHQHLVLPQQLSHHVDNHLSAKQNNESNNMKPVRSAPPPPVPPHRK